MLLAARITPFTTALAAAGVAAALGAGTELVSPSEYDTVTVPLVTAAALLIIAGTASP